MASQEPAPLSEHFKRAISLPPDELPAYLSELPPGVRDELEALLEADRGSENFFEGAVSRELPRVGAGEWFGAFETVAVLGRGGMGTVFQARRADGEVEQTVAIKVVERGWLDPRVADRFRQERQFLAGLSHPNIARLIDGGTRSDGVAYLIMEYVDGQRIDRYCDEHQLGVRDRLRLFLPLCEAVEYAHRKLIVHRDLKPSNVLVGRDGRPKLLDFGVAKALDEPFREGSGSATQTLVLTPDFASPEQVRGEEITTGTDVYGLGALLYCLLTGQAPHRTTSTSRPELERAICETPPSRPGALRPELNGDLENILLKALHRDTARRYHSSRDFADDVQRYLERRPVVATRDSVWYRMRRFVQRNRAASLATALALLATIAGTGISLYQARRARQGFAQVRELANKFIFEFEASIRDTPGTLEARRKMAATARQYLASLEADAGHDPALLRELAESHYRLSVAEGDGQEYDAWIADLQKAAGILRGLRDDCCGTLEHRVLYVNVMNDMVRYWVDRTPKEALAPAAEAVRNGQAIAKQWPDSALALRTAAEAAMMQGAAFSNVQRIQDAVRWMKESVRLNDEARKKIPDDTELIGQRAAAGNRYSNVLTLAGEYDLALASTNESVAILDPLMAAHPENTRWRADRIRLALGQANLLRRAARKNPALKPQATAAFRAVYMMARDNAARNPGNHTALDLAFVMTARFATQLSLDGDKEGALALQREAATVLDILERSEPADHRSLITRASNLVSQSTLLLELHRWEEAGSVFEKAGPLLESVIAKWPDDTYAFNYQITLLIQRADAAEHFGRLDEARQYCTRAIQTAAHLAAINPEEKDAVGSIQELRAQAHRLGLADTVLAKVP